MSETNFSLPLVPLRGMVVFPKVEVRLDIGRDKSIRAVEEAMANERLLAVSAQLDDEVENPTQKDIAEVGTIVKIKQMLRLPGGLVRILVEGIARAKVVDIDESYIIAPLWKLWFLNMTIMWKLKRIVVWHSPIS